MKISRKKAAPHVSNWSIATSERDMKQWGTKYGYHDHELKYNVDLKMPDESHVGFIGYGDYETESANKWSVRYVSIVTEGKGKEPWTVEYYLVARIMNGEEVLYPIDNQPKYTYTTKTRESCRTTKRNFFKDLMRDGVLALWENVDEYVARWEQANVPVTLTLEVPEEGGKGWKTVSYEESSYDKAREFLEGIQFVYQKPEIFRDGKLMWNPNTEEVNA